MARNKSTVYLGFEDEEITEKNKHLLNYSVNKIGGLPDWPNSEVLLVKNCPMCNSNRSLILQIYAPLENSQFHRTLYIFACLNPICSIQSKSWICIRTQTLDKMSNDQVEASNTDKGGVKSKTKSNISISWCNGSEDWGDETTTYSSDPNMNEENGNVICSNTINDNRFSDDDDESNSIDNDIINVLGNMNVDDKNANCGAQGGIGGGILNTASVYAEIEGEESELVSVESPLAPERDLIALMKQTSGFPAKLKSLTLKSFYIYVEEERFDSPTNYLGLTDHARELIQEYQSREANPESPISGISASAIYESKAGAELENYEKSIPAHGDIMFHNFMSTIQNNPGQIIRYSRDTIPLLIGPLNEAIPKCLNCGGECICEIQILSSLIPKLKLQNNDAAPIEYGNTLIFTCIKSCWDTPDKMRIENVIVQQET